MQFPIWRYSIVLVKRAKYFKLAPCVANMSAWFWLGVSPPLVLPRYLSSAPLIGISRSVDLGQCLVSRLGIDSIQIHVQCGLELLFCPGFLSGHQQGQPQM
jgi:hypothetical protein